MAPKLTHKFTLREYVSKELTQDIKQIKGGPQRVIGPVVSGSFKGEGLEAEIVQGGSDWMLIDHSTLTAHMDVRTQARTAGGESFFIRYGGVLKFDEQAQKALTYAPDAKTTQFGDHEWFSSPVLETSDPKFKWVENSLFVGRGRFVVDGESGGTAVEYEIYQVGN